jgi:hypothetical protein
MCIIVSDGLKCRPNLAYSSMREECKLFLLHVSSKTKTLRRFNKVLRMQKFLQTCGLLLLESLESSSLFACSGVAPNLKQIPMGLILPPAASQRRVS